MGYKLDNKDFDFNDGQVTLIARGKRGNVYKYKGDVIKVFNDDIRDLVMDEDTCRYLSSISTDQILLPKKLVFYNRNFCGYSMKLIHHRGDKRKIINTPTKNFIKDIQKLEYDLDILSSKKVLVNGMTPSNVIYNGSIYLTDPSRYTVRKNIDSYDIDRMNQYQLSLLLRELVLSDMRKEHVGNASLNAMKDLLSLQELGEENSHFYSELLKDKTNVKQLVKR